MVEQVMHSMFKKLPGRSRFSRSTAKNLGLVSIAL